MDEKPRETMDGAETFAPSGDRFSGLKAAIGLVLTLCLPLFVIALTFGIPATHRKSSLAMMAYSILVMFLLLLGTPPASRTSRAFHFFCLSGYGFLGSLPAVWSLEWVWLNGKDGFALSVQCLWASFLASLVVTYGFWKIRRRTA